MSEALSSPNELPEQEVMRAVFKIENDKGVFLGTGFLVHDQQHILTARHVVDGNERVAVIIDKDTNQQCMASVKKSLKQWDVALLELDIPVIGIEPLALLSQKLDPETKFRIYGYSQIFGRRWYPGKVAGQVDSGNYQITFDRTYQNMLTGLSGGPVLPLGSTYSVIGIIYEHGPTDLATGKIVPTEAFYNTLFSDSEELWCYVILSETDKKEAEYRDYTLRGAIKRAINLLRRVEDVEKEIKSPDFTYATTLVSSTDSYKEAVKKICQAKIAIFDITDYEPAVMLLLGIRSVVRRGVTIASFGGSFVIGADIDLPFNIKEINAISHSAKQYEETDKGSRSIENTPPYIIRDRIRDGLRHLKNLPQYLDLPTFDAIRNLPQGYRKLDTDNVLVLCSYSKMYEVTNWRKLRPGLTEQLDSKTGGVIGPRIVRVRDLMSPRLVSHTIYEAIRRMVLCIADWTEWRSNVFFELGVRLAVTNETGYTVSIIEDKYVELVNKINENLESFRNNPSQADTLVSTLAKVDAKDQKFISIRDYYIRIAPQCRHLLDLFKPREYTLSHSSDDQSQYEDMMHYYRGEGRAKITPRGKMGRAPEDTFKVIEENIDANGETTATPVYLELLRTADLFDVEESKGQATILYPDNETLKANVEIGIMQRLLAAWYYIYNEYKPDEIIEDPKLFIACLDTGPRISRWLQDSRPTLAKKIHRFTQRLRQSQQKKERQP